jgi:hypothetical protein
MPILMHQMRISTNQVSSVEEPQKLILCLEIEQNPSKDGTMDEGDTVPTERNLTESEPRADLERTQSLPRANARSEPRYLLADPASGCGLAIA